MIKMPYVLVADSHGVQQTWQAVRVSVDPTDWKWLVEFPREGLGQRLKTL
jgi:hypothetical protein